MNSADSGEYAPEAPRDVPAAQRPPRRSLLELVRGRPAVLENLAVLAGCLFVSFAGYWSILNNTLVGDDFWNSQVSGEVPLTRVWGLFTEQAPVFLRPLFDLTWAIHYRLLGFDAWPGHVLNVALHGGSAFLLFLLLRRLGAMRITSLLAALLFTVTPIGPEAVTWVTGRQDVMSLFFVLLSLLLYIEARERGRRGLLAGSMAAALAALLTKENGIVLVILLPALELIYRRGTPGQAAVRHAANREAASRLMIFLPVFILYAVIRIFSLGGLGGYSGAPLFGMTTLESVKVTAGTMLAPLNSFFVAATTIRDVMYYTLALALISLFFVILRWRLVSAKVRRLWLFVAVFFLVSLVSAYPYAFLVKAGIRRDMDCSRYLYFATLGMLTLLVVGLLEFGSVKRGLRIIVAALLVLMAPVYMWGLGHNNRPWEQAAAITWSVPRQAQALVPDPPPGARLYFLQNLPYWSQGAYVFINGLPQAVREQYGRSDLIVRPAASVTDPRGADGKYISLLHGDPVDGELVQTVGAAIQPDNTDILAKGYLFSYDPATGLLSLVRGPQV